MLKTEKVKRSSALPRCCTCAVWLAASLAIFMLAACSDESDTPSAPPPASATQSQIKIHSLEWLRKTDPVAPEQWLASREAGRDLDATAPEVEAMHKALEIAATRFRDYPRMIANRAVQLQGMLLKKGIDEHAPSVIATLCEVPGNTRSIESFASLTQQYYNLRLKGLDKGQAVAELKAQAETTP